MKTLKFEYRNWQGETESHCVKPIGIWFGNTDLYSDPQWFLEAVDINSEVTCDFALTNIIRFIKEEE